MRLSCYLRGRRLQAGLLAAALFLVAIILFGIGADRDVVLLVVGLVAGMYVLGLLLEWLALRPFWRAVAKSCQDPDTALQITSLVDEPFSPQESAAWNALDAVAQAGSAQAYKERQDADEYRQFVDVWVHEVKTPLAAARLLLASDNLATHAQARRLERELDRIEGYVDQALYYSRSGALANDYLIRQTRIGDVITSAIRAHKRSIIDHHMAVELHEDMDLMAFVDAKWMVFIL
ncbi:MAG: histidine kinase dimerization/phospho-acceptor domain-containing protein [Atopobiaceae bacterium]|jgi:signal transduction histidine kinase